MVTFLGWETENFFQVSFFSRGSHPNHLRFNSRDESNNHFFQGVFVFKNLVVHTPVWLKNRMAQSCMHDTFFCHLLPCAFLPLCARQIYDVLNSHLLQIFRFDTVKLKVMLLEFLFLGIKQYLIK